MVALFLLLGLVAAWRAPRVRPLLLLVVAGPYVWYFTSLFLNTVLVRYNFVFVGPLVLAGAAGLAWAPRPARWGASLLLFAAGLFWAHLSRPYWPYWDMVTQARIAEHFVEKGVPFVLDRQGWGGPPYWPLRPPGSRTNNRSSPQATSGATARTRAPSSLTATGSSLLRKASSTSLCGAGSRGGRCTVQPPSPSSSSRPPGARG